ncbi:hypothetical protein [Listeria booriae]|uniref:Uncharacterized protein n=1 Tax=Listeria booriae TaxID=1552123 RepID=A0A842F0D6_9LIST|nr:hypothetical protein [Listeria booriae]MBC2242238.1 hypothetical protein [Listeria booriae]
MKTHEFKKAVERLKLRVENDERMLVIDEVDTLNWLADVSLDAQYGMRMYFGMAEEIGEEKTHELAKLVIEYATTPIAERE